MEKKEKALLEAELKERSLKKKEEEAVAVAEAKEKAAAEAAKKVSEFNWEA